MGPSIAAELRRRPASESPATALRAAFEVAVDSVTADPATMATVMRLSRSEPALLGRHLQQQDLWVSALAEALGERLNRPPASPRSRMECGLMMPAWEKALTSCYEHNDFTRAGAELDSALTELRTFLS
ncbi:hypothetical protein ACFY36_42035 [Actinoplanes sp. NPDC000266]